MSNTEKKVLIVYGTRSGSTKEIAQEMRNYFHDLQIEAQIHNVAKLDSFEQLEFREFDGVLLGSGIRVGKWTKDMRKLIEVNQALLKEIDIPLGLFVSCGMASFPDTKEKAVENNIKSLIKEYALSPSTFEAFGGVYDFSKSSELGFFTKFMLKKVVQAENRDDVIDLDGRTDLRDWDNIKAFVQKFSSFLEE